MDQRDRFLSFLDAHHVLSLATIGPDGPHAANLFYARDGFALVWVSDRASRHSRHVEEGAAVAATVAPDYSDFKAARGVQIVGRARRLADAAARAQARRCLEARYPFLRMSAETPAAVREAYAAADFYRLEPVRMVMIDNSRGFAAKETLELEAATPPAAAG
jgi:uncharacterized protein YhbP (UPF0306 family)